ncbi:MAG: hypothetical protein QOH47_605 [Sphingomonadales bacterium]|nr:hypothetical protein [Sphingomonadales bacterium]
MRRLDRQWESGNGWPKRLKWMDLTGIRGWTGQRVEFPFPIVAISGENGSGKTTLLQAAACVYRAEDEEGRTWFPSDFFPNTAWDTLSSATIAYGYREGATHDSGSLRKPSDRWLGQPDRRMRKVLYSGLDRLQPVGTQVGYARIAKNRHNEQSAHLFDEARLGRLAEVLGRHYDYAKSALSDIDEHREVPVFSRDDTPFSGFHGGSGETTILQSMRLDLPRYGLVLIDEIESSLHPRVQRRIMRDLAQQARERECQVIVSTHSPFILEELPLKARIYIMDTMGQKEILTGVSPQFAMTQMDDQPHPEVELYVEDNIAKTFLAELLSRHAGELFSRCAIIPYGSANLGMALGQMVENNRLPRPSVVFLDGDNGPALGCTLLPGGDAPERVVFGDLKAANWGDLWIKVGRSVAVVIDGCERAMLLGDHHDWVQFAADYMRVGGDSLWHVMCAEWAQRRNAESVREVVEAVVRAFP